MKTERPKIYERNPDTGVIRWRYIDESHDKFGWPNWSDQNLATKSYNH